MEIPGKIRIGGQDIFVGIVERIEDDKLGQICVAEGKLLIAGNFSTRKKANPLWQTRLFTRLFMEYSTQWAKQNCRETINSSLHSLRFSLML